MQKSYPISNSLRAAGLRFKADFTSQSLWSQQGGSISGDPTFSDAGVVLDSNDDVYLAIPPPNILGDFQTQGTTIVLELTPTFASNSGTQRNIVDSRSFSGIATQVYLWTDNTLVFTSTATVFSVPYVTWSAVWNESSKNVIVLSIKSGDTSLWINGSLIVDSDVSTFSNQQSDTLSIGSRATDHAANSPGTYSRFEIYHWACDSVDEPYLRNGTLIQSLDTRESVVTVPMEIDYDNGSGLQVTPATGQLTANVLMGSNGVTTSEFPTKDTTKKRGYIFDGGDRMRVPANSLLSATNGASDIPFTWACVYRHTENAAASRYIFIKGTSLGVNGEYRVYTWNAGLIIRLYDSDNHYIGGSVAAAFNVNQTYSVVITYDGSETAGGLKVYIDGIEQSVTPNTSGVYDGMTDGSDHLYLGYNVVGTLAVPRVFRYQLSPLQAKALRSIMMSEVIR